MNKIAESFFHRLSWPLPKAQRGLPISFLCHFFLLLLPLLFHAQEGPCAPAKVRSPGASAELYNMKDLEVLKEEKNYSEFFLHARDVRPSLRDQHWKDLVNVMAENLVQELVRKKNASPQSLSQVAALMEWPILQQNEFFMKGRDQLGLIYFRKCFASGGAAGGIDSCLRDMTKFWREHPFDPYLGVEFAKLGQGAAAAPKDLWVFIQKAVKDDFSFFLCQSPVVQEVTFSHLNGSLLNLSLSKDKDKEVPQVRQMIDGMVSAECWKRLKEELKKAIYSASGHIQENAFTLLKAKAELEQTDRDYYLTLYLLQGPTPGDIFNESWNNLKELGQNNKRRVEVLELLKKLDPLPGKVFALYDHEKMNTILDYLSRNFPEYMDHYARTCLDFYSGKKGLERGNPTIHCRDLLRAASNTTWVDPQLLKGLTALQKRIQ